MKMKMSWELLKCAFGIHNYGTKLHDVIFDKWIMICRVCGKEETVEAPLDKNGKAEDPHEWLMKQEYYLELTEDRCCFCDGLVYTINFDGIQAECIDCKEKFILEDAI